MRKRFKASPARVRVRNMLLRAVGLNFPTGSRIPSVRDLADQLEAAGGTVRWAIGDLVREGLLVTRPRSGVFVSADFNADQLRQRCGQAASGRGGRLLLSGRSIELLHIDGAEHFASRMSEAFEKAIHEMGGRCCRQYRLDPDAGRYDLRDSGAKILACFNLDREILCRDDQTLIFASASREQRVGGAIGYDLISVDQEQGGAMAARALQGAGHTTACFVGAMYDASKPPQVYGPTSRARLTGFLHGWGGGETTVHRLYTDFYSINSGAATVAQYMELRPRPGAVFAASDELALGFIAGALAHGLQAGRDYSIVGFDGLAMARALPGGPLTTVEVPVDLLGQRAAKLLVERLNHPRLPPQRVFLGCSMLPGNTLMVSGRKP